MSDTNIVSKLNVWFSLKGESIFLFSSRVILQLIKHGEHSWIEWTINKVIFRDQVDFTTTLTSTTTLDDVSMNDQTNPLSDVVKKISRDKLGSLSLCKQHDVTRNLIEFARQDNTDCLKKIV